MTSRLDAMHGRVDTQIMQSEVRFFGDSPLWSTDWQARVNTSLFVEMPVCGKPVDMMAN